jgi:dipeptide/tripeptide permease
VNQVQPETVGAPAVAPAPNSGAKFGRTFWILNSIEMWERLAYYNLRVMAPIYIMQADNPGSLHLTAMDKGVIYLWWSIFQSVLPTVTGGLADRFGYKRTMAFAISTIMIGYLMIAFLRDVSFVSNYTGFFLGILTLATGTAFFKPSIQGSLALNMPHGKTSVGWGTFYWVVNVGAFIGHYLPPVLLGLSLFLPGILKAESNSPAAWRNLFVMSALFTSFNLLLLFTFKDTPSGASTSEPLPKVLWRTLTNVFEPRLLSWILIMSGFWLMMYQLWDLHPNFITDWVDSRGLAEKLRWLPDKAYLALTEDQPRGRMIPQAVILSANSMMIICAVVAVSWLARHMRTLSAMTIGMVMGILGLIVSGWTQSIYLLLLGVVCFSFGEMLTGPKKSEYLSLIAPPGKTGLYLGYVNIPAGIGSGLGGLMAGYLYKHYGEKAVLALKYLATQTPWGKVKGWNGDVNTLEATLGVPRSEAMLKLQEISGLDAVEATNLLWNTYHPHYVWIPFALVGVVSALALYFFGRMARKWKDMNA